MNINSERPIFNSPARGAKNNWQGGQSAYLCYVLCFVSLAEITKLINLDDEAQLTMNFGDYYLLNLLVKLDPMKRWCFC